MARINVNPALVESQLLLEVVGDIQRVRAKLARYDNIFDLTRAGADFTALGAAWGVSAGEAATLYARMRSIEGTMNGVDFQNLSDVDQGG